MNAVLIVLFSLFIAICAIGAWGGLDSIRRHQQVDFMAPVWFVASGLGLVLSTSLLFALIVSIIADAVANRQTRR